MIANCLSPPVEKAEFIDSVVSVCYIFLPPLPEEGQVSELLIVRGGLWYRTESSFLNPHRPVDFVLKAHGP